MKIDINLAGSAVPADFDLLKATLVAMQAATPTARAARAVEGLAVSDDGAVPTFADLLAAEATAAALAHRFAVEGGKAP